MLMEIYKDFSFDAAHQLHNLSVGHKCAQLHGHSFQVRIFVSGTVNEKNGWIIDFSEIQEVVEPVIEKLDHQNLNEINGLGNPTCENIAIWIWQRIDKNLAGLCRIEVRENSSSGCVYSGNDNVCT